MTIQNLKLSVIGADGKTIGEEKLALSSKNQAPPVLVAQAVRVYLINQRKAWAKTKTRAEVAGSKSKIYRQKGTGRARHGDRQAPIFVGGGVAHGPRGVQNYKKKISRKMVQKVILSVLIDKIREKKVFLTDNLDFKKTKEAFFFLQKVKKNIPLKGKIAFIVEKSESLKKSLANLDEIMVLEAESLNAYSLLKTDYLLITNKAWKDLKKRCR